MTLRVVVVHPDLLGTYGDGGNGLVVVQRARWRGIDAVLVEAPSGAPVPDGDLFCLGGGEDAAQSAAAAALREDKTLARAIDRGAPVLAVCAGYQIAGRSFAGADGRPRQGLGLIDVTTRKGEGPRAVGEIVAAPLAGAGSEVAGLGRLSGFENHGGLTTVGPDAVPLAHTVVGVGNGDGTEGAVSGRVVGTYLHGPVLARNPALADLLLSWATGTDLGPLDDAEEEALRHERFAAAMRARPQRTWSTWLSAARGLAGRAGAAAVWRASFGPRGERGPEVS